MEKLSAVVRNIFQWNFLFTAKIVTLEIKIDILNHDRQGSQPIKPISRCHHRQLGNAHSSEMILSSLGAPTKSFRILFVSWATAIKSPTLNPKLILVFDCGLRINKILRGVVRDVSFGFRETRLAVGSITGLAPISPKSRHDEKAMSPQICLLLSGCPWETMNFREYLLQS